ncbi:MAG: hypothetical protein ACD_62C00089G0001, partial [uncultured bacterium]
RRKAKGGKGGAIAQLLQLAIVALACVRRRGRACCARLYEMAKVVRTTQDV